MKKRANNILTYIISFSASAIGIVLNFFLARVLEAELYGKVQYYIALATTISQFLIFGLNSYIIREAKNEKHGNYLCSKCFSLYISIAIFAIPIVYFLLSNYFLSSDSKQIVILLVIIVSLLIGLDTLITSFFQGVGKYHLTVIFELLIPKLLMFLIAIVFLVFGKITSFPNYYLLIYIGIYSFVAIPFFFKLFESFRLDFSREDIKSIVFFFGVTITYSLGNNITKVLQGGIYKNSVALATISVSLSIISLIKVFTAVLDSIVKPIFAKKKRENDIDGLLDIYRFDTRMNSYVSIPLYLYFIFNADKFLSAFGQSYTVYPHILVILSLANAVSDLTGPNGTMLAMTGHEKWELTNGLLYFGIYIIFSFVFTFDKIHGLCYALLLSQIAVNVAKYIEIWRIYKRNPLDTKTILSLLMIIAIDGLVVFGTSFIVLNIILWFVINVFIGVVLVALNCFVYLCLE